MAYLTFNQIKSKVKNIETEDLSMEEVGLIQASLKELESNFASDSKEIKANFKEMGQSIEEYLYSQFRNKNFDKEDYRQMTLPIAPSGNSYTPEIYTEITGTITNQNGLKEYLLNNMGKYPDYVGVSIKRKALLEAKVAGQLDTELDAYVDAVSQERMGIK